VNTKMTIDEFTKLEFTRTLIIPLKSSLQFEGLTQQVVTHNGSIFVWTNGDINFYPLIIVPVTESQSDQLYGFSKTEIMFNVLEYLSILTVQFGVKVDIHHDYFKNYFGLMENVSSTRSFISRIEFNHSSSNLLLPRYHKKLTNKQSLIIGLFRDGFNNENIFSSFLSYFKIFENYFSKHEDRNQWIDDNFEDAHKFCLYHNLIKGLDDWKKFLDFVSYHRMTKGEYFNKKCRVAIAHAKKDLFINPNNFSDYYELFYSREVIKILAWYLIIWEFKDQLDFSEKILLHFKTINDHF
jgi:hypothetical protein